MWGTSPEGGSSTEDYANKQWGGLMGTYYRARRATPTAYLPMHSASLAT